MRTTRLQRVGITVATIIATLFGALAVPIAMAPPASAAIETLSGCGDHALAATDDGSSSEVALPFTLGFFGQNFTSVFVNNNGNVTFGAPLGEFTPFDLT